jgi:hypothetical protein
LLAARLHEQTLNQQRVKKQTAGQAKVLPLAHHLQDRFFDGLLEPRAMDAAFADPIRLWNLGLNRTPGWPAPSKKDGSRGADGETISRKRGTR